MTRPKVGYNGKIQMIGIAETELDTKKSRFGYPSQTTTHLIFFALFLFLSLFGDDAKYDMAFWVFFVGVGIHSRLDKNGYKG